MKNHSAPQRACFKYQLTKTMISIAVAVLLLCGVGLGFSVYRIQKYGLRRFSDYLQSPFLIAVCLFCIAVVLSILIKSQYIVTDTHYVTQFGFIKSKFDIKEITSLELDKDTGKLTVYVGEEFSVLSLSKAWCDDFVAALRKVNPNIDFTFTLTPNQEEE